MEVYAISDNTKVRFGDGRRGCAQQTEDTRVTVVEGAHGVEEVRYHTASGFYRGFRFFVGCF